MPFSFKAAGRANPFRAMPGPYLLNNYALFRAIRSNWLFARHERLLALARRTLGDRLFFRALKATLGRQFTCGESVTEARPVVEALARAGFLLAETEPAGARQAALDLLAGAAARL